MLVSVSVNKPVECLLSIRTNKLVEGFPVIVLMSVVGHLTVSRFVMTSLTLLSIALSTVSVVLVQIRLSRASVVLVRIRFLSLFVLASKLKRKQAWLPAQLTRRVYLARK